MASEEFEFRPGPDIHSVRIIFGGFWNEAVLQRYAEALRQRREAANNASPINRVLLDLRDCSIQSQEVIDGLEEILKGYTTQVSEYGLLLPRSPLTQLQMKRLMQSFPSTIFDEEEDAVRWLER